MSTPLTEDQAALRLGVTKDWLKARRGPEGERWHRGAANVVLWHEEAIQALLDELGAASPETPPPDPLVVIEVTFAKFPNRKILEGTLEGSESKVLCHVPDAHRFAAGQQILARAFPGKEAYIFAGDPARPELGPVLPRHPGRWP